MVKKNKTNEKKRTVIPKNLLKELKNKTILITGGAGSIGTSLTKKLLEYPVKSVRVLDIAEHSLFKLSRSVDDPRLRLLLGSILDKERVEMAGNKIDIIFHTAAIKNIEISELNALETIDVNINGTVNMVKMLIRNKPEKFLYISSDKAAEPSTLYGTTKQLGERITTWAGNHLAPIKCGSVRLGNVIETRGNVFEVWNEEVKNAKPISVTDPSMKRYFFHIDAAINFILKCLPLVNEGEIFVPKMKSYKIQDMAYKISKNHKIIGIRHGEKIEEVLITKSERKIAEEKKDMWVIKNH